MDWKQEQLALFPAEGGGVGQLRYRWCGPEQAPALVCVHGFLDHGGSFEPLIAGLAERWRVVLLDRRGYGASDWCASPYVIWDHVADLAALARRLAGPPLVLVGHSAGTYICAAFAASHPERVGKLALLECYPIRPRPETPAQSLKAWIDGQLQPLVRKEYASLEQALGRLAAAHPRVEADRRDHWGRRGLELLPSGRAAFRYDPRHRLREPQRPSREQVCALLAALQCPVLAVRGAESPIPDFPAELQSIPQLQTRVLADAAHMPHLERPEACRALLAEFLAE